MWNGFDFDYFYLDRNYQSSLRYAPARRTIRNLFACCEGPFGRRPHYPDDPVDPVQLFFFKYESIPLFLSNFKAFI
ncbi:hypothetical protein D1AOALGA4SA_3010 [Olavius algarvensis Delta 1 endosymbiont]|nr:hypothetical protein D1AOALGA4SA_3010 [Olavius algarvensis Delta 1 endosymbiont]